MVLGRGEVCNEENVSQVATTFPLVPKSKYVSIVLDHCSDEIFGTCGRCLKTLAALSVLVCLCLASGVLSSHLSSLGWQVQRVKGKNGAQQRRSKHV